MILSGCNNAQMIYAYKKKKKEKENSRQKKKWIKIYIEFYS